MIECAFHRQDDEMRITVQAVLDSQGEQASVEMHKNCYCSYTYKEHIKRFLAKKRKVGQTVMKLQLQQ